MIHFYIYDFCKYPKEQGNYFSMTNFSSNEYETNFYFGISQLKYARLIH